MKRRYLFGLVITLVTAFVVYRCTRPAPEDPRFVPVENPNPKYFITYQGFIDPSLNNLVKLTIVTVYTTNNDACLKTIDKFEGVHAPRKRNIYTVVKPDANGRFSYRVPLDMYLPGFCRWQVDNVGYVDKTYKEGDLFNTAELFSSNKKDIINLSKEKINFECSYNQCNMVRNDTVVDYKQKYIPIWKNNIVEFNFFRRKHD